MKKIIFTIAILGTLTITSCKDFLDLKPTNSIVALESMKNVSEANIAMNGVYNRLAGSNLYGRRTLTYADLRGGDLYVPSNGRSDDSFFLFNHEESRNNYGSFWDSYYNVIMLVNNVLENIQEGNVKTTNTTEEATLNDIKGQALTVRALAHFDLVRLYGAPYLKPGAPTSYGVPIVTTVLDAQAKVLRNTVADVYTQIITDLTAAIPLMKTTKTNGKLNQYGAKALLARVYLTKGDYDNAYTTATSMLTGSPYTLYTNAQWVSSWATAYGAESIFEIAMSTNDGTGLGNSSLTSFYAPMYYNSAYLAGGVASTIFLNLLGEDPTDVRWGIMDLDEYGNSIRNPTRSIPNRKGWIKKYMGDKTDVVTATNVKVIRLSEVYLIAAEAAIKKTTPDKASAVLYLNAIRKRAPALALADAGMSVSTLETLILNEKSKELIGEGHRYFDLMRLGKTITFDNPSTMFNEPVLVTNGRGVTVNWDFNRTILPISDYEINANPGLADQQNPGYR